MTFERMLRYCARLEMNNNRTWFHENHEEYEAAKQDFTELLELLKFAAADLLPPELAEALLFAEAKQMQYRVPRDMRVRSQEPPYTPSFRAYLAPDRHTFRPVGYFLRIAPGGRSIFGTGVWFQDREDLRRVRQRISDRFDEFSAALDRCSAFPLSGDRLKRPPAGFSPEDPAVEYLKYKNWFVSASYPDGELTDFESFVQAAASAGRRMEPLRRFFDEAYTDRLPRLPWEMEEE